MGLFNSKDKGFETLDINELSIRMRIIINIR